MHHPHSAWGGSIRSIVFWLFYWPSKGWWRQVPDISLLRASTHRAASAANVHSFPLPEMCVGGQPISDDRNATSSSSPAPVLYCSWQQRTVSPIVDDDKNCSTDGEHKTLVYRESFKKSNKKLYTQQQQQQQSLYTCRRVIPPSKYTIVQQEKDNKLLRPNDGEEKEMTGVFFLSLFLSHSDCLFPSNIPVNPLCELMAPYRSCCSHIVLRSWWLIYI
jgi:hypothetical protein